MLIPPLGALDLSVTDPVADWPPVTESGETESRSIDWLIARLGSVASIALAATRLKIRVIRFMT
jgi:hypothetical protein